MLQTLLLGLKQLGRRNLASMHCWSRLCNFDIFHAGFGEYSFVNIYSRFHFLVNGNSDLLVIITLSFTTTLSLKIIHNNKTKKKAKSKRRKKKEKPQAKNKMVFLSITLADFKQNK